MKRYFLPPKIRTAFADIIVSEENVNTNNGWGFGGFMATNYKLENGHFIRVGVVCYRHAGSYSFISLRDADGRLIADTQRSILEQRINY